MPTRLVILMKHYRAGVLCVVGIKMQFNQFLLTPYFGPGLLPHEQTIWIDELTVGRTRAWADKAAN